MFPIKFQNYNVKYSFFFHGDISMFTLSVDSSAQKLASQPEKYIQKPLKAFP